MPTKTPKPLKGVSLLQRVNSPAITEATPLSPESSHPNLPEGEITTSPAPEARPPAPDPLWVRPLLKPRLKKDREQTLLAETTKSVRVAAPLHKRLMFVSLDMEIDFSVLVNRVLNEWEMKFRKKETPIPPPIR